MRRAFPWILFVSVFCSTSTAVLAADTATPASGNTEEDLAKQLANPVAALISVPLQSNYDLGLGLGDDGWRYTLNVQPVVPFSLGPDWNVISRTILPIIYQEDVIPGEGDQEGLGDTTQSLFFAPSKHGPLGAILGFGPALLFPTATDHDLGTEKWGAGPTAVGLLQHGPWTYGMLTNHIWSFAGDDERSDVNSTFLQPFVNYTTKSATSFLLNTETTYDWENEHWTVPINAGVQQLLKLGPQRVQFGILGRWYAEAPNGGPEWGLRFPITFLFPR